MRNHAQGVAYAGVFGAIGFLLMSFAQFPIVPGFAFLRFDPGEFPLLLLGLTTGPRIGLMSVVVKDLLYLLFRAKSPYGPAADFIACAVFVYAASFLARRLDKSKPSLILACTFAALVRIIVMVPANMVILHLQFGFSVDKVLSMIWPVIIPFNVVKSVTNSLLAIPLVLYLPRLKTIVPNKKLGTD